MQFLVTGGAGFIGSHIAADLQRTGGTVRVLDNLSSGNIENLKDLGEASTRALEIMEGDLRDPDIVRQAVSGVEVVFHEAAFVSVPASMKDPRACFAVNCAGTSTLLEAARQAGVRRVVLASSAAVYGDSKAIPLQEESALRPLSPYAASKLVDEIYAQLYTRSLGLEVCALRYFNVYGPRQRPDTQYAAAVPIFIDRLRTKLPPTIFGDGGQTRDLIFVGDVVRANRVASEHAAAPGGVFNVCTGRKTSILDLIRALYELLPGAPPPEFAPERGGDIRESVGSPSKTLEMLGFEAQTSLISGLKETIAWTQ